MVSHGETRSRQQAAISAALNVRRSKSSRAILSTRSHDASTSSRATIANQLRWASTALSEPLRCLARSTARSWSCKPPATGGSEGCNAAARQDQRGARQSQPRLAGERGRTRCNQWPTPRSGLTCVTSPRKSRAGTIVALLTLIPRLQATTA